MTVKTTLSAIVIDDEPKSRFGIIEILKAFCSNEVIIAGYGGSLSEGRILIQKQKPDIVFLDIELGSETGFSLLENLDDPQFQTIVVTAHSEYAIRAIKFSVLGYLMKPVLIDELKSTIEKARRRLIQNSRNYHGKLTMSTLRGQMIIEASTIVYCKADGSYTHIHLATEEKLTISKPLRVFADTMAPLGFFRIHNSYLVNTDYVALYTKGERAIVKLKNGTQLPLARNRKHTFETLLSGIKN